MRSLRSHISGRDYCIPRHLPLDGKIPLLVIRCHPVGIEKAADALENEGECLSRFGSRRRREWIWIASGIALPWILKARIVERDVQNEWLVELRLVHHV